MDTDAAQNSPTASPKSALEIFDEMSDMEWRKYNIVVCKFSECADCKADLDKNSQAVKKGAALFKNGQYKKKVVKSELAAKK